MSSFSQERLKRDSLPRKSGSASLDVLSFPNQETADSNPIRGEGIVTKLATSFLVFLGMVFVLAELFSVLTLRPFPYARTMAVSVLALSFLLPEIAICLFLASLPVFGNKPNTLQYHYLILAQCCVVGGLFFRHFFENWRFPSARLERQKGTGSFVWLFAAAFGLVSLFSLTSLPQGVFLHEMGARIIGFHPKEIAASLFSFISLVEDKQGYAILSAFLTFVSIAFAWLLVHRIGGAPNRALQYGAAILAGLLLSLAAGIADYYNFIDLRGVRGLDPMVNPGNAQFRLQSFFGHSGWYAEYVTMTVPFVLLILLQRTSFWSRVLQMLAVLLAGEFALILTFQRGGWVSYPLTLFAIWAAIYVVRRLERGEEKVLPAVRGSLLKVLVSVPLTVVFSVLLINFGMKSGSFSGDVKVPSQHYVNRLEDISRTSDRTDFMVAAYRIASLHPFFGAGSESFGYQFHKEFERADGHYPGEFNLPLHGTAHSLYFQVLSGKGVFGLLILVALMFHMLVPPLGEVVKDRRTVREKIQLLVVACFACSFLIYGVVQEIFYIHSLQVLFFAVVGIASVLLAERSASPAEERLLWRTLLLVLGLHLLWEKVVFSQIDSDYLDKSGVYGCFVTERSGDGRDYTWCAPHARLLLPVKEDAAGTFVTLNLGMDFLREGMASASLTVRVNGTERVRELLPGLKEKSIRVPLSNGDPSVVVSGNRLVAVDLETDSWFVPAFVFKTGNDYRLLSLKVYR